MAKEEDGNKGFSVIDRRFWAEGAPPEGEEGAPQGTDKPTYVAELERNLADKDRKLKDLVAERAASLEDLSRARERMQRELRKEAEAGRRVVLGDLIEVLDNLDRALDATRNAADPEALREGVVMVRDLFVQKLAHLGVSRIEAKGATFDPSKHEALSVVKSSEDLVADGEVVDVLREGYAIGNEVLRPAGVAVARRS